MGSFDEEVRDLLHDRAEEVAPAADLMAGVEARAGTLHRRRRAAQLAGSAIAVLVVATAAPGLIRAAGEHRVAGGAHADGAPRAHGDVAGFNAAGVEGDTVPMNALTWPKSGAQAPQVLVGTATADFAATLDRPPGEVHHQPLWAGRTESGTWLYAFQGWTRTPGAEAHLAVYRTDADGAKTERVPPQRVALGLAEPAPASAGTAMRRGRDSALIVVDVDPQTWLVLTSPTARVSVGGPGATDYRPLATDDGVAIVTAAKVPATVRGSGMQFVAEFADGTNVAMASSS